MKIFLGADHGGFYLKEKIEAYLTKRGIEWEDVGDKILDPQDDFPQFAQMAVTKVLGEDDSTDPRAILICTGGQGMAHECRNDNNCNVLCLPARVLDAPGDDLELWKEIIDEWIATPFAGAARFVRRNAELDAF